MMEIQKQLLLFMSGIHSGFLNLLVQVFTIFGEEFLLIAISVFIYWNINKKNGFVISMSLMNALSVMGIAKAIVDSPDHGWSLIIWRLSDSIQLPVIHSPADTPHARRVPTVPLR